MTSPSKNPHTPQAGSGLLALAQQASALEEQILALAEQNDGEVDGPLDAMLDEIKTGIATKADQYKFVMDRLDMTAQMLDAQADQFLRASKALENVREAMKARIKEAMNELGVDEVKGATWRFKLSKTKPRLIIDEKYQEVMPQEFVLVKTVYEPDKERIRTALEAGKEVRGAVLEQGYSLRSYVNKDGAK